MTSSEFNFVESRYVCYRLIRLEEMFSNIQRLMGLTLFVSKYLPFSEPEVTILSPRTVLNIHFRPGQAFYTEKADKSENLASS